MLCFTAFQFTDAYWAPSTGTGNLAYLGYCQRILVAVGNLIIAGPAAVILTKLAASYAAGKTKDLIQDTMRAVRMVILFAMPIAVAVSILANPVVQLLFERGAFDQQATYGVALLLPWMMLGMIAMLCVVIIFKAFFAMQDINFAAMIGGLTTAIYFILAGFFSQRFGVVGISVAYAMTWWFILLICVATLWRGEIQQVFSQANMKFAKQLLILCFLTGCVVMIGDEWIVTTNAETWVKVIELGLVAVLSAIVYFTLAIRVLKVDEICIIYVFITSKLKAQC
jgi:putative peptidoglycan lipid II flippase